MAQEEPIQFIPLSPSVINSIEKRNEEIKQFERDISLLAEIQQDLQQMVEEQQENIDLTEENISTASEKVVKAETEIKTANEYKVRPMYYVVAIGFTGFASGGVAAIMGLKFLSLAFPLASIGIAYVVNKVIT